MHHQPFPGSYYRSKGHVCRGRGRGGGRTDSLQSKSCRACPLKNCDFSFVDTLESICMFFNISKRKWPKSEGKMGGDFRPLNPPVQPQPIRSKLCVRPLEAHLCYQACRFSKTLKNWVPNGTQPPLKWNVSINDGWNGLCSEEAEWHPWTVKLTSSYTAQWTHHARRLSYLKTTLCPCAGGAMFDDRPRSPKP